MFRSYEATIRSDRCDCCKERAVGVEHVLRGTPVLFQCRTCAPKSFEDAAEALVGRVIADVFGGSSIDEPRG